MTKCVGDCDNKPAQERCVATAVKVREKWYMYHRPNVQDGQIGSFEIRVLEVVKKYAVLLAFLSGRREVNQNDMALALQFGDYFFSTAKRLITQEIAENRFERNCQKILRAIRRANKQGKPTTQRELMRRTSLDKWHFERCMETLAVRADIDICAENGTCSLAENDTDKD